MQELREAEAERAGGGKRRRLPAGTSEYQAAWILDDDDGDDLESDDDRLPGSGSGGGGGADCGMEAEGGDAELGGTEGGGTDDWREDDDEEGDDDRMEVSPHLTELTTAGCARRKPNASSVDTSAGWHGSSWPFLTGPADAGCVCQYHMHHSFRLHPQLPSFPHVCVCPCPHG